MQQIPSEFYDESSSIEVGNRNDLENLIDNWIAQQPVGNISNLQTVKDRILNYDPESDDFLDLSNLGLETIPPISNLRSIKTINLSHNRLSSLGEQITLLGNSLRTLNLSNNQFSSVPEEILNMQNISRIEMSNNPILTLFNENSDSLDFNVSNTEDRIILNRHNFSFLQDDNFSAIDQIDNSGFIYDQDLTVSNDNNDSFLSATLLDYDLNFGDQSSILTAEDTSNFINEDEILSQLDIQNSDLVDDLDASINSIPSNYFLSKIVRNAEFTQEELNASANEIFGLRDSREQNLASNLTEIENLFTITNQVRNNNILANFLQRIVSSDTAYERENSETKKIICRQILKILNVINKRKSEEHFFNEINIICSDGLDRCGDRAYLNLCNLSNFVLAKSSNEIDMMFKPFLLDEKSTGLGKRKVEELSIMGSEVPASHDSRELLKELKLQATYNYIVNLAQLRCEKIRDDQIAEGVNPSNLFSEDVEVYLNYMRIFNAKLIEENLECRIPLIKSQRYFDMAIYQPNEEEIGSLVAILKSVDDSKIIKFLAENIRSHDIGGQGNVIDNTQIYQSINLAICDIATEYVSDPHDDSLQSQKRAKEILKIQRQIISNEFEDLLSKVIANQSYQLSFSDEKARTIDAKIRNDITSRMQQTPKVPARSPLASITVNRALQEGR